MLLALIEDPQAMRDILYLLNNFGIGLLLYVSVKMFIRGKEDSFISSSTAFGLYALGYSFFYLQYRGFR